MRNTSAVSSIESRRRSATPQFDPVPDRGGQAAQRVVQSKQVNWPAVHDGIIVFDYAVLGASASFECTAIAFVAGEYLAHEQSAHRDKMRTVLKVTGVIVLKARVRFVHQGGGLQGAGGVSFSQLLAGGSSGGTPPPGPGLLLKLHATPRSVNDLNRRTA